MSDLIPNRTEVVNFLRTQELTDFIEGAVVEEKKEKLSPDRLKQFLSMDDKEFETMEAAKVAAIVEATVTELIELEDRIGSVRELMGRLGESHLTRDFDEYGKKVLQYKDALIAKISSYRVSWKKVAEMLVLHNPKLKKQFDRLRSTEQTTYEYYRKALESQGLPKNFPKDDPLKMGGSVEAGFGDFLKRVKNWSSAKAHMVWKMISKAVTNTWRRILKHQTDEMEDMIMDLKHSPSRIASFEDGTWKVISAQEEKVAVHFETICDFIDYVMDVIEGRKLGKDLIKIPSKFKAFLDPGGAYEVAWDNVYWPTKKEVTRVRQGLKGLGLPYAAKTVGVRAVKEALEEGFENWYSATKKGMLPSAFEGSVPLGRTAIKLPRSKPLLAVAKKRYGLEFSAQTRSGKAFLNFRMTFFPTLIPEILMAYIPEAQTCLVDLPDEKKDTSFGIEDVIEQAEDMLEVLDLDSLNRGDSWDVVFEPKDKNSALMTVKVESFNKIPKGLNNDDLAELLDMYKEMQTSTLGMEASNRNLLKRVAVEYGLKPVSVNRQIVRTPQMLRTTMSFTFDVPKESMKDKTLTDVVRDTVSLVGTQQSTRGPEPAEIQQAIEDFMSEKKQKPSKVITHPSILGEFDVIEETDEKYLIRNWKPKPEDPSKVRYWKPEVWVPKGIWKTASEAAEAQLAEQPEDADV